MDINAKATVGLKATAAVSLIVCSITAIGIKRNISKATNDLNNNLSIITAQAKNTMVETQQAIKSIAKQIEELELKECSAETKKSLSSLSTLLNALENKVTDLDSESLSIFLSSISDALKCMSGSLNAWSDKVSSEKLNALIDVSSVLLSNSVIQKCICNLATKEYDHCRNINNLLEQIREMRREAAKKNKKCDQKSLEKLNEAEANLVELLAKVTKQDCNQMVGNDCNTASTTLRESIKA